MERKKAHAHVKCPCGATVEVPVADRNAGYNYDIMSAECSECGRIASAGNCRTGQISSWMTPKQINRANDEYQAQLFSADMNDMFGRGEGWW